MELTALIVDDEAHIRRTIRAIGRWDALGIQVMGEASDGLQALQLITEYRPDIVLLDMRMPGMDGLELLRQLERHEVSPNMIIVSGHDDYAYMHQAIRFGAKDYILKPIDREALNASLGRFIGRLGRSGEQKKPETGKALPLEIAKLDPIASIYEFIVQHYVDDLSLSSLSQQFYINREFLSRTFKKRYDIGITAFINQLRVNKARELLQKGCKVHSAAESVGFCDVNYFSKLFKKQMQMTPTEYTDMFRQE